MGDLGNLEFPFIQPQIYNWIKHSSVVMYVCSFSQTLMCHLLLFQVVCFFIFMQRIRTTTCVLMHFMRQ